MVGAQGVLLDQGQQAVRVGTSDISLITGGSERMRVLSNGNVGIGTNNPIGHLHVSSNGSNSTLYVGKAITSNGEYKDSYFIRPSADINNHAGLPSTYNYGGSVLLQSSNLYHNTWSAWNEAGALRLIAGSVYSRGNSGNAPGGHEIGGDVVIDSGAVVRRTDGGAGPYTRGGNIHFRTGNVYNVSSEAAVNTYPVDYTTRMYISGENGSVGVGTTWTSKHHPITMQTSMHINPITITVGGNINTWYKVKISSVTYNMCKFSITRSIHQDQQERGSMALDVEFRSSNCGNQSAHIAYKYNQFSYGPYFVARVSVDEAPDNYCSHTCCYVYLLGSCSYYFSGMNCYIEYNSPDGTSPGTINSLTTRDIPFSTGEQILSHDSRTAISSVLGNVGIGTGNPTNKLNVMGDGDAIALTTSTYGYTNTFPSTSILFKARRDENNFPMARIRAQDVSDGASNYGAQFSIETNNNSTGLTERLRIDRNGNVSVWAAFSASSKNFDIQHPLHPENENKRLVHGCVEGPRNDLLYRGTVRLQNGRAVVNIDRDSSLHRMSDGTFEALCRDPVFYLQPKNSFDRVIGEVVGANLTILCENQSSSAEVNWMVVADRKDKTIVESNMTDAEGYLITEYTK